jgi:thiamine transport system substrate-binding protein
MQKSTRKKLVAGIFTGLGIAIVATVAMTFLYTPGFIRNLFLTDSKELTVVTHDSAVFPEELLAEFKAQTGITVKQVKAGDTGSMVNKLILTKDAPIGDRFYGIDSTFLQLALDNEIYDPAGNYTDENGPVEIDYADVCINYDKLWFSSNETAPPKNIGDLTKPAYKGLTVVTNPRTSSPGLSFLAATVAVFGESGWKQYWTALKANDVKIAAGWEDAYFTEFSGSSGKGQYPIVLSYSSSPAFEIRDNGESQTVSLLDACYRQWEYAGALANGKNAEGATKFIDFMVSDKFQSALPESNYVYPAREGAGISIPSSWAEFAPAAGKTVGTTLDVAANRELWFAKWSEIFDVN